MFWNAPVESEEDTIALNLSQIDGRRTEAVVLGMCA